VLPDGSGIELLREATTRDANTQVVVVTGHASLETSIEAMRHGATDYLLKPINLSQLRGVLSRVARPPDLSAEVKDLRSELRSLGHFGRLVGGSPPMQRLYDQLSRVAPTGATVFITGESGTGKEIVAQTIHEVSRRRLRPFLAVNCGAISPQIIESELFGHEKGSFTGANRQHRGYFERAHGGTLFLDEITEMPPALQVKLLRVLETGSFMRVGSTQLLETDVRVIAATNRNPAKAVAGGALREDLYWRLNVFPIELPPLRDRIEDLPLLAQHFLRELGQSEGLFKRVTREALAQLAQHRWPGNVRELRNVLQCAYVMTTSPEIGGVALPREASRGRADDGSGVLQIDVGAPLATIERQVILATLEHFGQHRERAAAALGVSLKTLYNRLKNYGL